MGTSFGKRPGVPSTLCSVVVVLDNLARPSTSLLVDHNATPHRCCDDALHTSPDGITPTPSAEVSCSRGEQKWGDAPVRSLLGTEEAAFSREEISSPRALASRIEMLVPAERKLGRGAVVEDSPDEKISVISFSTFSGTAFCS